MIPKYYRRRGHRPDFNQTGLTISGLHQQQYRSATVQRRSRFARTKLRSAGFTIVELMIATLIFSVILIAITVGVISFTNAYYQGVNASNTQVTARNAMDAVSQAVQFSGGDIESQVFTITRGAYCIGSLRFDYNLGYQITGSGAAGDHALWETPWQSGTTCVPTNFSSGSSKELLEPHMWLTAFSLSPSSGSTGLYSVNLGVVYGDADLLCTPDDLAGSCAGNFRALTPTELLATTPTPNDVRCRNNSGASQFCAISYLNSTLQKRVQ